MFFTGILVAGLYKYLTRTLKRGAKQCEHGDEHMGRHEKGKRETERGRGTLTWAGDGRASKEKVALELPHWSSHTDQLATWACRELIGSS